MNKNDLIHRAIPVRKSKKYPEGFIRVACCDDCMGYYEDKVGRDNCRSGEWMRLLRDCNCEKEIHKSCPLLTVAQVREYPASEKPVESTDVEIKFQHRHRKLTGYSIGFYDHEDEKWCLFKFQDDWPYLPDYIEVISWRNLPGQEVKHD